MLVDNGGCRVVVVFVLLANAALEEEIPKGNKLTRVGNVTQVITGLAIEVH